MNLTPAVHSSSSPFSFRSNHHHHHLRHFVVFLLILLTTLPTATHTLPIPASSHTAPEPYPPPAQEPPCHPCWRPRGAHLGFRLSRVYYCCRRARRHTHSRRGGLALPLHVPFPSRSISRSIAVRGTTTGGDDTDGEDDSLTAALGADSRVRAGGEGEGGSEGSGPEVAGVSPRGWIMG